MFSGFKNPCKARKTAIYGAFKNQFSLTSILNFHHKVGSLVLMSPSTRKRMTLTILKSSFATSP
jgi:hypothetical protein